MKTDTQNPLLVSSGLTHNAPDFGKIEDRHFLPAFKVAIADYLEKASAVAENPEAPTFENTIYALEMADVLLSRVCDVFFALSGSDMTNERQAIQEEVLPLLQQANSTVYQNAGLFARVEAVAAGSNLDTEQARLVDDYIKNFVQAGIRLNAEQMKAIAHINSELSSLGSKFGQALLKQYETDAVVVDSGDELAGLDANTRKQLAKAADNAGHSGKYLIKPSNATAHPFLTSLENRALRERLYKASTQRGDSHTHKTAQRILELRQQKAQMLGYRNWAEKQLDAQTAGSTDRVFNLVAQMAPALKAKTDALAAEMTALLQADGEKGSLKPWDWHYYAAKLQQQQGSLDPETLKPYFAFEHVLEKGVFYTMETLYGIKITPRPDLPVYHEDVRAYEITDADGTSLAIFYGDYFSRPGKRGGAWKTNYVQQFHANGQRPVVVNVCNITKAEEGSPTFISLRDAHTLFHEFGHALHEIFSQTRYASNAGTAVPRDYVEFPSTYQEDWAQHPDVLANYAFHHKTGEPLSPDLVDELVKTLNFSQAFDTFEYLAATVLDMELHMAEKAPTSWDEFEQQALAKHGLDSAFIAPRYRVGYFRHIFASEYSASYYAYIWSRVLAADAFAYTCESGGLTAENGKRYREMILAPGDSTDPTAAYRAYRGTAPTATALLKRRGIG
mgnify:CR=1 FL=1